MAANPKARPPAPPGTRAAKGPVPHAEAPMATAHIARVAPPLVSLLVRMLTIATTGTSRKARTKLPVPANTKAASQPDPTHTASVPASSGQDQRPVEAVSTGEGFESLETMGVRGNGPRARILGPGPAVRPPMTPVRPRRASGPGPD